MDAVKSMVGEGDEQYEVKLQPNYRDYEALDAGKAELEEKLRSKIKENESLIAENLEVKEMIKGFKPYVISRSRRAIHFRLTTKDDENSRQEWDPDN